MGERELREKYGGKLAKALNRAIRAETPTGNVALDRLANLSGPAAHSGWTHPNGEATDEAAAYHKHKKTVDRLEAEVRQRWGIEPAPLEEPKAKKRKSKKKSLKRKPR